jgi:RNA polymerase sigma factor (sigma-70 family)
MATNGTRVDFGALIKALDGRNADDKTDGQLLAQFLNERDEAAFATLVRRHGPMVLGVCRRILGNQADADDAFQAAFIVLVRKAASLTSRSALGDWLHGVARRTALRARADAARRRVKEQIVERDARSQAGAWERGAECRNDWLPLLDEELSRLPEKYRLPIVLCDLEGNTRHEAAKRMGWPEGTVASRLVRGRALLAKRLIRSAQVFSGVLTMTLAGGAVQAALPLTLVQSTVQAAALVAAGKLTVQGVLSAKALILAQGVIQSMFWNKMKLGAFALFVALVCGIGYGTFALSPSDAGTQPPAEKKALPQEPKDAKPDTPEKKAVPKKEDKDLIQGTWKVKQADANGKHAPKEVSTDQTWMIANGTIVVQYEDGTKDEWAFKLDAAAAPRAIDVKASTGFRADSTAVGIYELKSDTLRVCVSWSGPASRPTAFDVGDDRGGRLFVLQRVAKPKAEKVPDPSPELQRDLADFEGYRNGSEEKFVELERKANELLKKYTARDDQARIYYQVAHIAAQSNITNHVKRVQTYARKSLALCRDPLQRAWLYSYLGSAAEADESNAFEDRRRQAAAELLAGYAEILAQDLPKVAPELPAVNPPGDIMDPLEPAQAQRLARHAAQMAARAEAEFIRALVWRRDTLANQLKWLYRPHPNIHGRNPEGPEELRTLAGKVLNDPKAVDALLTQVTGKVKDVKEKKRLGGDGGRPNKLAKVPDPAPELQRDLADLDGYWNGSEEKFAELERKANELLKKYTAKDDQARIYYHVAHIAAQRDIRRHVKRVQTYARKSLALSRDPLQRGGLYTYLGCAAEVDESNAFAERRRQAAAELLAGYAEMLAQGLPKVAPELQGVDPVDNSDTPAGRVQDEARHAAQMAARKEAEFIGALVSRRDTLANQLKWLYQAHPNVYGRNPEGPEELRALAGKVLNDPKSVDALLAHVIAK